MDRSPEGTGHTRTMTTAASTTPVTADLWGDRDGLSDVRSRSTWPSGRRSRCSSARCSTSCSPGRRWRPRSWVRRSPSAGSLPWRWWTRGRGFGRPGRQRQPGGGRRRGVRPAVHHARRPPKRPRTAVGPGVRGGRRRRGRRAGSGPTTTTVTRRRAASSPPSRSPPSRRSWPSARGPWVTCGGSGDRRSRRGRTRHSRRWSAGGCATSTSRSRRAAASRPTCTTWSPTRGPWWWPRRTAPATSCRPTPPARSRRWRSSATRPAPPWTTYASCSTGCVTSREATRVSGSRSRTLWSRA